MIWKKLGPISLQKIRNAALFLSFTLLVGGAGYWLGQHELETNIGIIPPEISVINKAQPLKYKNVDFSMFWQVWEELEKTYLWPKDMDSEKMVYGAISGMTQALGDPYTVFLAPSENKQTKENLSGSFYGVGIQIGYKNRRLAVVAPLEGMPAERAGIEAGDYILQIVDSIKGIDLSTQDMTLPEAVSHIRGEKGTSVKLSLYREGDDDPYDAELLREEIVIPSVKLNFTKKQGAREDDPNEPVVAHIHLTQFGERTRQEWDKAVSEILSNGVVVSGIVLDLRNNPGGYLTGAVEYASEFINEGTIVVQQGRYQSETFKADGGSRLSGIPLVVLINEGSASASEILAGALRDRLNVKIVGEQSFGKGTVQEARDLSEGAGIHVTTAEWILPSGTKINSVGLTPDIEVSLEDDEEGADEQLKRAIEELIG